MTKEIMLSQGYVALVDDGDYEELSRYKWEPSSHRDKSGNIRQVYAFYREWINGKRKWFSMHRKILNPPDDLFVDHINGNTLDNRRENLRVATRSQNAVNRPKNRGSRWNYKGVRKRYNKWAMFIGWKGNTITKCGFNTEEEAARAYDVKARELYGQFAYQNFPD